MQGYASAVARAVPGVLLCAGLAMGGAALTAWLELPVPGAVVGLLAYLGLMTVGPRLDWSRPGAALLIRWIGALIVPALVGLEAFGGVLAGAALPLAIVLVTTTLVTALATAAIFHLAGGRS